VANRTTSELGLALLKKFQNVNVSPINKSPSLPKDSKRARFSVSGSPFGGDKENSPINNDAWQ